MKDFKKVEVKDFGWRNVLRSPFVLPRLSIYIGKKIKGVPYFLPRKQVYVTFDEARQKAMEVTQKIATARGLGTQESKLLYNSLIGQYRRTTKYVDLKVGTNSCSLGWKDKWGSPRFEWAPMWSFVFFNFQIHLTIKPPTNDPLLWDCYWEAFIYYFLYAKGDTVKYRLLDTVSNYSATWGGDGGYVNYYHSILKPKYKWAIGEQELS